MSSVCLEGVLSGALMDLWICACWNSPQPTESHGFVKTVLGPFHSSLELPSPLPSGLWLRAKHTASITSSQQCQNLMLYKVDPNALCHESLHLPPSKIKDKRNDLV